MFKKNHIPLGKLPRIALVIAVITVLAAGIWLARSATTTDQVVAQVDTGVPADEGTPAAGEALPEGSTPPADGVRPSGRTPGQRPQAGAEAPADGAPAEAPAEPKTVAPSAEAVDAAAESASTTAATSGLVAIAGVDGAPLSDSSEGEMLYTVDVGTAMQATGRSDDSKWLYVGKEAVIVNGQEVAAALAGWTPKANMIVFSVEDLPVIDAATAEIIIPGVTVASAAAPADDEVADTEDGSDETVSTEVINDEVASADTMDAASESDGESTVESIAESSTAESGMGEGVNVAGVVNLDDSRLNVRAGSSVGTAIVGKLNPRESVLLLGRNDDGSWLLIAGGADSIVGWVSAQYIDSEAATGALPIVPASVEPAPSINIQTISASAAPMESSTDDVTDDVTESVTATAESTGAGTVSSFGKLIVFQTSPGGTIYAYDLTDGALWPLTSGFDPAISPDGLTVAFTRDGGENGLYLIGINGKNERRIFAERGGLASPKWSPDGEWIVFSRSDSYAECYMMGRSCVSESTIKERDPDADMSKYELVRQPKYHLAMVDVNGDNYTDIAALDTSRAPDWVDSGIVYQSSAGLQITQATSDAENQLVINDNLKPFFYDPDWQPDAVNNWGRIAYMGKEDSHWEIFTVNADGTGVTALTKPETTLVDVLPSNVAPAWSPDGTQIIFLSNREENNEAGAWRIWIMDADGSNQRPLDIDVEIDYTFGDDQTVSW